MHGNLSPCDLSLACDLCVLDLPIFIIFLTFIPLSVSIPGNILVMAECPEFAKEALSASLKYGDLSINISTTNVQVVIVGTVCITAVTLSALYTGYKLIKPLIDGAVKRSLGGERDDQEIRDIKPGSLNVLLHCLTDERFLEVLEDYECGRLKERLQEEFLQAGIKIEGIKVEILNMEEVRKTKEAINER
jgi:hypothetical protein